MSDAESYWPKELKKKMRSKGKAIVMQGLKGFEKFKFVIELIRATRFAKKIDLSPALKNGLNNPTFLKTQTEYLTLFRALSRTVGTERAIVICKKIMDETAREALLLCFPEIETVKKFEDPLKVFSEYFEVGANANIKAGCFKMHFAEKTDNAIEFHVNWCAWLELARVFEIPEGCIPNCYSDDLAFPEYFKELGIKYTRTQTLAINQKPCNFRFERIEV
ncbi:L-2-amino-thiazoline-4-carboxylic acid hydrolase [bacterium]|nr:L-2-amino-thiazoline-4-carboxylic acid hydrolase [bacterium]